VAARRVVRLKEREVSRRSHSPEDFPSQGRRRGGEHTTETRGEGGQVPCEKGKGRQGEEGRARISNEQRPRGRDRKRASPRRAHSRETGAYRAHCPRHIRGIRVLRLVCPPAPPPPPPVCDLVAPSRPVVASFREATLPSLLPRLSREPARVPDTTLSSLFVPASLSIFVSDLFSLFRCVFPHLRARARENDG